jgi:hypothetical protein
LAEGPASGIGKDKNTCQFKLVADHTFYQFMGSEAAARQEMLDVRDARSVCLLSLPSFPLFRLHIGAPIGYKQ